MLNVFQCTGCGALLPEGQQITHLEFHQWLEALYDELSPTFGGLEPPREATMTRGFDYMLRTVSDRDGDDSS